MCLGGFSSRRLGGESQGRGCWRGGQLGSGCHLASTQRHLLAPRHLASTGRLPRGELLLLLQVVRQERHERLQQCSCKVRRLQVLVGDTSKDSLRLESAQAWRPPRWSGVL